MLSLAQFEDLDPIYSGVQTMVYRAWRVADGKPVIIKTLRNTHPSFRELVQFRNQFVISSNLDSPHIVKPLALERYDNGYLLIMPDQGAISLKQYLTDSAAGIKAVGHQSRGETAIAQKLPHQKLQFVLKVALQLTTALHHLSTERVVHKDIKPANILIHPQTGYVQLIDFSIASLLPKEQQEPVNPKGLEGTLAYIAPEQTGRMNRGIDYRTDFYSLGVTLYELLTGQRPFLVEDPLALLYCHIAQNPVPPSDLRDSHGQPYPAMLSAIIMKLMAKNAEDRYQSALGLKYDLGRCVQSLAETGNIAPFTLGERDICDRFNIPEKLYGREQDVTILLEAFERVAHGNSEMMLVAGFSGIGKTAVVNEVHKPIARQRGYFIKGKFDQVNRNIPFSAFVQAFRDLMGQLLGEDDAGLQQWRAKILEAVGEHGQVLIEVIPELEQVIGPQPPVPELSGHASQNRFHFLFEKFIAVFTTAAHSLTIFVDDLQWADAASFKLMQILAGNQQSKYLLLLGAYRDNEVSAAHPLRLLLANLAQQDVKISTIALKALSQDHVAQLVAASLSCPMVIARPLSDLIYQQTQGNPFFTTQYLKGLHEDSLITFNPDRGRWQWDLVQLQHTTMTNDVVAFMAQRLQKLPRATQNTLKLAACIGNQFDLKTLAMVCEDAVETIATNLWDALLEGLLLPVTDSYKFFQDNPKSDAHTTAHPNDIAVDYRFLHDRVQQAVYSLIPAGDRHRTHYRIGQCLLAQYQTIPSEDMLFTMVEQLNKGHTLLVDTAEKNNLAQLNLSAARKAKTATAYAAALEYAQAGINLLADDSWESHYALTLDLFTELLEIQYLNTNFDAIEELAAPILTNTQTVLDKIKVYEVKIRAWIGKGDQHQALETGLEVLEILNISFCENRPNKVSNIPSLVEAPEMSSPELLAAMKIMEFIITPAWAVSADYFQKVTFTMVDLSLKYGSCSSSAFGYIWYGTLLCESFGDIDEGYEFGQVAVALLDRFHVEELRSKVLVLYASCIGFWKEHVSNFLSTHLEGLQSGLETGDLEFASYGASEYSQYLFLTGVSLDQVLAESTQKLSIIQHLKQDFHLDYLAPWIQGVVNLLGENKGQREQDKLSGQFFVEEERLPILLEKKQLTLVFVAYFMKSFLSYTFDKPKKALEAGRVARKHVAGVAGTLFVPVELFYSSLARIACFEWLSEAEVVTAKQDVLDCLQKLQHWSDYAPMNYQHKCDLIRAELASREHDFIQAIDLYDRAIAGARENGYIQEEALANELFAKFYLHWGKVKYAALHMQDAYYCYTRWGAIAKTTQLEARYPELLAPILQPQQPGVNLTDSLTLLTQTLTNRQPTNLARRPHISEALDLTAILQAAQKLTSIVELEPLLEDITEIILTNASAQKMALLTPGEEAWQIEAIATRLDQGQIQTQTTRQSLTADSPVPIRLIRYVKNTRQPVFIRDADLDIPGILEGYLLKYQPQSVLCLPLINQGSLVAIAYLEHPTTKGIFTESRQTIVEFLCGQAAVALQNAQLYQQAQRSQMKAEQTLAELQQAQLQLVQSEKMSALGNLVAGVAHEINNPVGFLQGNIKPAQDYIQDLFGLLDLYQATVPNPNTAVEAEIETIDLAFIRADLPKLLDSMNLGVNRICNISNSLRTFSRKDQDYKTAFNLHDGLDSTLLILKHRTKASDQRPKVDIIKQYGEVPEVQCFPGQLNQVFMNILANAINAFDDANGGKTFAEIEAAPNVITIQTACTGTTVNIQIKDNGCGMAPETVDRVFEQGFTTKAVGKGTGLGMAIAHQIITKKHDGQIICTSTLAKGTKFEITLPL